MVDTCLPSGGLPIWAHGAKGVLRRGLGSHRSGYRCLAPDRASELGSDVAGDAGAMWIGRLAPHRFYALNEQVHLHFASNGGARGLPPRTPMDTSYYARVR